MEQKLYYIHWIWNQLSNHLIITFTVAVEILLKLSPKSNKIYQIENVLNWLTVGDFNSHTYKRKISTKSKSTELEGD